MTRNVCFLVLLGLSVLGAFVYPTNVEGSLKSLNSFNSPKHLSEKSIDLKTELGLHQFTYFPDKTTLYKNG